VSDLGAARTRRPTSDEGNFSLIQAALRQQGQLMAQMHDLIVKLTDRVDKLYQALVEDERVNGHDLDERDAVAPAP
jgi:hypothetical protein